MSRQSPFYLILRLWHHLNQRRQRQYSQLLVLMILTSFAEIISIGAVLPFLGVVTAPESIFDHRLAQPIIHLFGFTEPRQLLLPMTLAFILAVLITGGMRILLLYTGSRISFATGADLGIKVYRRTLYQNYAVHTARNSSEIIDVITNKIDAIIYHVLTPALTITTSVFLLIATLAALLAIDIQVTILLFAGLGTLYGIIIRVARRQLDLNSKHIAHESTQALKSLQEGLGGIRDILIDSSQEIYCQIYRKADLNLRYAQAKNQIITVSPRFAMEALGMILIAVISYALSLQAGGITKAIPILGAMAFGAQRLLPVLQQGYNAYTNIKGHQASLQDVLRLLEQPLPLDAHETFPTPISFTHHIEIRNLSFRYAEDSHWVLRNITLTIKKGSRTGFLGTTGSGKTTLLDIIMGLLIPTKGVLTVDGQAITPNNRRAWQGHIAHVPQTIYLADRTIEENIAFSVARDQIDHERVLKAARQAQIADLIDSWPEQYETIVGERGVRLSGGQRQRIGIARALYKKSDIIIFDEATSALDDETEHAVMEVIKGLSKDLTILIIAHRINTLKNCNHIIKLGDCGILWSGSYQDLPGQK